MPFFKELAEQLNKLTEAEQLRYQKAPHSTAEGERYEEGSVALVFLRCLREGLQFALSANDVAGGKFDDVVLFWKSEESLSALFVQLKHKTSAKYTTIRRSDLMWRKKDNLKDKKNDFSLNVYHDSYKKMGDSLDGESHSLVLCTNLELHEDAQHMFVKRNPESVPGMKLLDSGGCLYSLNSDDADVSRAVEGDDRFIQHFYLFSNQSNNKSIKSRIYTELKQLLSADESYCKDMCVNLYSNLREWMNTEDVRLTSNWDSWLNMIDTYVKEKVTSCNSLVTRIKYRCVEALDRHIRGCNPAWIRPPGQEATALSATKVHQAVCGEGHIMVSAARLRELQQKILCCWGPFCRWLVVVDDDTQSTDALLRMRQLAEPKRRLVIVSYKGDDSFRDTCRSGDICDNSWKELVDVKIQLNSEQHVCCLKDLCDTEALKAVLDGKPEALVALSQLSGPVRMGQDLHPLPENYIPRRLTSRIRVRREFFSSLGDKEVCILDEVSYQLLTKKSVLKNTVRFEELENYLSDSDAVWPIFVVTKTFDRSAVHVICSKHEDILLYVLSYRDGGWEIMSFHRGSEKIRPYVKEKSRSLLQVVNGLSNLVIVEGKPGVGKSAMLLDMASQVTDEPSSWWVLRIDLLEYSHVFDNSDSGVEASKNILLRAVYNEKNLGILEHALLQHCLLEYPHIICLVDGFDEVCPDYADICIETLQELAPRRGKLVVTTRPSVTDRLEAALGVLAHSLPAFNEDQLQRFHGWSRSETGVRPTDAVRDLLKIPLFSTMYAESLESGIVLFDIVSLYEAFFERKFRILYEEKWCDKLSVAGKKKKMRRKRQKHEKQLELLAVSHLLPRLEVPGLAQSSSIDRDDLVKAGVIYQFIDDKPVFIHRTFAEYFLAKWCFSDVADDLRADVYCKAVSDSSLEFFVECFDRMASRDRPLLMAVLNGREGEVESLLENGADPAEVDSVGRNSLHLAAAYGRDSTLLRLLVERLEAVAAARAAAVGAEEAAGAAGPSQHVEAAGAAAAALGAEDGLLRWTPLRYAAERRRWRAVAALLEVGARLRHLADFQRGLHSADQLWRVFKQNGYRALVLHILGQNGTVWNWRMVEQRGEQRTLEIKVGVTIASAEMSEDQYLEIGWEAVTHQHGEVVKLLWHKITDMKKKSTSTECPELELDQGSSQLKNCRPMTHDEAGLDRRRSWHRRNKQTGKKLQQTRTARDGVALHDAAATGDAERLRRLIEAGADVNFQISGGISAIHAAASFGSVDCIKLLYSAGADVNLKEKNGQTALHCAAGMGSAQSVRLLLDAGADELAQDSEGHTPLHAAAMSRNTECVRLLASALKNLELTDLSGSTALHYAAANGDDESVKHLIREGAHCSPANGKLDTPLHLAAYRGNAECVRLLLQEKANVAARGYGGCTALHEACMSANPDCVRQLLEAGARVQERDQDGGTPLHYAAETGSPASVRLLVSNGADVHERDRFGRTPLHDAALEGKAKCVKLLLDAGADALARDSDGRTPLHMAAVSKNTECISLVTSALRGRHAKSK